MAQQLQKGEVYQYTASGAVSNGELRVINRMAGVAMTSAVTGDKVSLALDGVFSLPSVATGAKAAGSLAYYRTTGSQYKIALTATGSIGATGATGARKALCVGTIWETAATSATSVKVKLVGMPMKKL